MFVYRRLAACLLLLALNVLPLSYAAPIPEHPSVGSTVRNGDDDLAPEAVIYSNSTPFSIPDDGYNGTLGSMGSSTIAVTAASIPAGAVVSNIFITTNITHTWVGDLTIKLRSPNGTVLTLLNRPGSAAPDTGTDNPPGNLSNWANSTITFSDAGGPEAETMGSGLTNTQNICINNGICGYDPSPDTATTPPSAFSQFNDQPAAGNWTLFVGDSAALDTGTVSSWSINLTFASVVSASPMSNVPDDGYAGGFGGVGMACSTINTTALLPAGSTNQGIYLEVDMSHTWVGDLTMKLRSPSGVTLTFLNRPGSTAPDDGTGAIGNGSNWAAGTFLQFRDGPYFQAESMGSGLTTTDQRVCLDNGICQHAPSPDTAAQPPSAFSAFNGQTSLGNWTLCVGDSAVGDAGVFRSWRLKFPNLFAPTAASVGVSGRVFTPLGSTISKARVTLTNSTGQQSTVLTNPFGHYLFDEVLAGEMYTISVEAKGYSFEPRTIGVADEIRDLDFVGQPSLMR